MKHIEAPVNDLRERFILFLASKPAHQGYEWKSWRHCACGTFIRENLTTFNKGRFWWSRDRELVDKPQADEVWSRWNSVAQLQPNTYGALLKRVQHLDTGMPFDMAKTYDVIVPS